MYIFLFLQFDLPAHIYSFSFTKHQNYKNNMKIFTFAITLHKKKPICYAFKCNKQKPFLFRLPSMLF